MATKPDTRHLDTAIGILKNTGKSKRAKPASTFILQWFPAKVNPENSEAILQGPRGKTVATFRGKDCKEQARAYVARIPGATMNIFCNA